MLRARDTAGQRDNMWLKLATVQLTAGTTYTVTIEANAPTFVSQHRTRRDVGIRRPRPRAQRRRTAQPRRPQPAAPPTARASMKATCASRLESRVIGVRAPHQRAERNATNRKTHPPGSITNRVKHAFGEVARGPIL